MRHGFAPMYVEQRLLALEKGQSKGKGKHKPQYAQAHKKGGMSKGKGKEQKGTGKSENDAVGKMAESFEGYCSGCSKWGHTYKDCWYNPQNQKGNVNALTATGESDATTVASGSAGTTGPVAVLERPGDTDPDSPWFLPMIVNLRAENAPQQGAVLTLTADGTTRRVERVFLNCCAAGSLGPPRLSRNNIDAGKTSRATSRLREARYGPEESSL